jgi:hypothetical protein
VSLKVKSYPAYWITSNKDVEKYLNINALKGKVFIAGKSAGGRNILAYEYGDKEALELTTTMSSACAAGHPESFLQPSARKKPVLMIYSTIHGAEVEGCATLINLINIIEKGCDLSGRRWDHLYSALNKYRLVIVPLAQPDGRERFKLNSLVGESFETFQYYAHGRWKNGSPIKYPQHKMLLPLPAAEVEHLGGYFNDNYVNIQHDDFFGKIQPETQTLLELARNEMPDCIFSCHSCEADPGFGSLDAYISENCRVLQAQVAGIATSAQLAAGFRVYPRPNLGTHKYFYLQDILHMATGALPLLYEFPHGIKDTPFTHREIIDLGLTLFQEVVNYGLYYKFHPRFENIFLPDYHKKQSKHIQAVIKEKVKEQNFDQASLLKSIKTTENKKVKV